MPKQTPVSREENKIRISAKAHAQLKDFVERHTGTTMGGVTETALARHLDQFDLSITPTTERERELVKQVLAMARAPQSEMELMIVGELQPNERSDETPDKRVGLLSSTYGLREKYEK